jgi:mannose-1-phosphate guanylyltransferase/mannose-6-phosphate isomerase
MTGSSLPPFVPVILSGGSGTRLWPLSRRAMPKQLLALTGDRTLLQETTNRLSRIPGATAPIIIANDDHRFEVRRQLDQLGIEPASILLEPMGRNTAPAVALACRAALADGDDPIVGIFPSDHRVSDETAFRRAMKSALVGAEAGAIVTLSIAPDRPDTGFGYIRRGASRPEATDLYAVDAFVEKPDRATAEEYVASGAYGWNGGMFVFRASVMLAEIERHEAKVAAAATTAFERATRDLGFIRLDAAAFSTAPSISIDVAVMERTTRAATVPVEMGWSDLGSWHALHAVSDLDPLGNAVSGPVATLNSRNCLLRAEDGRLVAAVGLSDTVVVSTADAVLIAPMDRVADVKGLVSDLIARGAPEAETHHRVARPWGRYEDIDRGDGFKVKRIVVDPGGRLSLQRHARRSEHWIVARGVAHVTIGDTETVLERNQSTYVPIGATHRLENRGDEPLHLIEVQVGDYVEEDDIERLDDVYGRSER